MTTKQKTILVIETQPHADSYEWEPDTIIDDDGFPPTRQLAKNKNHERRPDSCRRRPIRFALYVRDEESVR